MCAPDLEMSDGATSVDDHAQQVVDAIGNLTDVVLAGHSYGGMPVTLVADRVPERLARVVYLDAFAPRDGDNAWTQRPELERILAPQARDGLIPPLAPEHAGADPEHYDLLREKLTTMPLRCFAEPVHVTGAGKRVPRTYVLCTRSGFGSIADRVRNEPGWDYRELDTEHMAMLTMPSEVSGLLLDCAVM